LAPPLPLSSCHYPHHRDLRSFPTRRSSDLFRLGNRLGPSAIRAAKGRAGVYPLVVGVTAVATLGLLGLQASSAGLTAQRDVAHADRKSTRLNSSHVSISYAVFCLKKKNNDA